ncbi:MAG: Na+/H+ antiporter [Alphaproteobacteria bacterium]|nr:Na+/H+ antiporter [Alphaproteobacteria bacterium]
MELLRIVLILLLVAAALGWIARRLRIPYPIVLVLGGLALGFVPGLPVAAFDPHLLLLLVLPPVLYQAALFTSWRDFIQLIRPISFLAVGLVLTTTLIVGAVGHYLLGLPWPVAFVLGAIVSPPDAVAATAVLGRLRMPRRLVVILEGESLVNDATGLVLYKLAIAAVMTGAFSFGEGVATFFLVGIGGVLIGLAFGGFFGFFHRWIGDPLIEISLSLVLPFVAYFVAEAAGVSGVLAVVTAGLVRGWQVPEIFSARSRMQAYGVWEVVVFLVNSIVFILIGMQLEDVLDGLHPYAMGDLMANAAIVVMVAIGVRFAWVFAGARLVRRIPVIGIRDPMPPWQHLTMLSWCGMRGIVSLAAALAVPYWTDAGETFPHRDLIIFLTFSVILVTLVVQGLSLGLVIRWLGVAPDGDEDEEEREARMKTAHAAREALDELATTAGISPEIVGMVRADYDIRLQEERASDLHLAPSADPVRMLRLEAVAAQRRRLLKLRRDREIGDEVMHRILRELDLEEARLMH